MNSDLLDTVFNHPTTAEYVCIEFGHPLFSRLYRFTPSISTAITVTHENGIEYTYLPLQCAINLGNTSDELEQTLDVTIGGMDDELEDNLNLITSEGVSERPYLDYRRYRKGLLSRPIISILGLLYQSSSETKGKITFSFSTPKLNQLATAQKFTFALCTDLDTLL